MRKLGRTTSSTKILAGVSASLITVTIYMWIKNELDDKWYYRPSVCHYPSDIWDDYMTLLEKLPALLRKLHVRFFLCYGSLWGAIRYQRALEWDTDLDLCVLSEDINSIDTSSLISDFRWEDFAIEYRARDGVYVVRFGKVTADLVLFEQSSDGLWFERVGWGSRLFSNFKNYHFPARLALHPLPTAKFHDFLLPVPRGGKEIMQYLYPDDWWKEVRPPGC